jgi:hypothetical protein
MVCSEGPHWPSSRAITKNACLTHDPNVRTGDVEEACLDVNIRVAKLELAWMSSSD